MSDKSAIEWTDATWNPVRGCTKISPGCAHCYAETFAERFRGVKGHPYEQGFDLRLVPEKLDAPLHWKKPRRVFVNSMSDLFHEGVPDELIDQVFAVMAVCPEHTFQVLSKRPERMLKYMGRAFATKPTVRCIELERDGDRIESTHSDGYAWPLPNVWLGVSVESQKYADERIPLLLQTPAAVRFVSAEPLLGALDFVRVGPQLDTHHDFLTGERLRTREKDHTPRIDWVIVGGESGHGARPMHPEWARLIRGQCQAAGVAFFFKQWGEFAPLGKVSGLDPDHHYPGYGKRVSVPSGVPMDEPVSMFKVGKKAAGRLLDGCEWNECPETKAWTPTVTKP